jgi:hypothetical protein
VRHIIACNQKRPSLRRGQPQQKMKVTRLWCIEGCGMQDAKSKHDGSGLYILACGHERTQMTSELRQIADPEAAS